MEQQKVLLPKAQSFKLYKRRWVVLALYILYAAINAFQWFEYSIIANISVRFYKVSAFAIDWTSIIYTALYMPMVVPASYLISRKDLRYIAKIGVTGTALGTVLKIFTLAEDRLWLVYVCQTILSSMQVFILALPPLIASTWFGAKEVSLACALGVFGTQLGQAVGFIVPPLLVKNHEDLEEIGRDLGMLTYGLAVLATLVLIAVLIYFPARPPSPPSELHTKDEKEEEPSFMASLRRLLSDPGFNSHACGYGIIIGVFIAISTLLNQFILFYFPEGEEAAGIVGLLMVIFGMLGSVIFGYFLDKTHKFKETAVGIYVASVVAILGFMYSLERRSKKLLYVSGGLVGFFINAYMPVGLEMAIELTYPEPESTSSGILISMTQTLGVFFTLLLRRMFAEFGCFWALANMLILLVVGAVLTAMVPNVLKRQEALSKPGVELELHSLKLVSS